mgnify:CR=1 FL=1
MAISVNTFEGSSPHTRGARPAPVHQHVPDGIIPAYAGSTPTTVTAEASRGDHPRIRGEHDPDILAHRSPPGSSPHTRGARGSDPAGRFSPGIIPAYAGSTAEADGPHYFPVGSSPHTRGAPADLLDPARGRGIIPAYAGSTWAGCLVQGVSWDHPRIRGEHCLTKTDVFAKVGSSPHTRGARPARPAQVISTRIIPAYAGSTTDRVIVGFPEWDHPRIRGEHVGAPGGAGSNRGSSPHTRGALSSRPPNP